MAKKFFYNRVYNTKRTIINLIIIGACIIGVIVCFIVTSNFQGVNKNTPEGSVSLKKEVTVEVNETYSKEIFFSKIENITLDDISVTYPDNFDIQKTGSYDVTITINKKNYNTILKVVDTSIPELVLKEVTIKNGSAYNADDFVEKCTDNAGQCKISFYADAVDEDGKLIDYSNYTQNGVYSIKISALDESGNQTIQETTLNIVTNTGTENPEKPENPKPENCKYGNNEYNKENYLIAVDKTNNSCALSLDLYKDESTTKEINQLMETESIRIKKDVDALNLTGTLALNRMVSAVVNTAGDGIVGYELKMTVTITNNGKSSVVAEYKVDKDGKRVFITNTHNLGN